MAINLRPREPRPEEASEALSDKTARTKKKNESLFIGHRVLCVTDARQGTLAGNLAPSGNNPGSPSSVVGRRSGEVLALGLGEIHFYGNAVYRGLRSFVGSLLLPYSFI